jgi:quercetin dioxygenase-like cupin family protein
MSQELIKNVEYAKALNLDSMVEYAEGQVVSRTLAQAGNVSLTLFAFDKGEGLSSHTAAGDALVQILDGSAEITIGDEKVTACAGQVVAMPANVPHALHAPERFKMYLAVVKPG